MCTPKQFCSCLFDVNKEIKNVTYTCTKIEDVTHIDGPHHCIMQNYTDIAD